MIHRRKFIHSAAALPLLVAPSFAQLRSMKVTVLSEVDGWFDVTFPVQEQFPYLEGGVRIGALLRLGGDWNGSQVEWGMLIPDEWEEAKITPPPPISSWATGILLGRTGPKSDELVRRLSETYGLPNEKARARDEVALDAVSLFVDPRPVGSQVMHLKVFLHATHGSEYGEFNLIIDLKAGQVRLKEKDPGYRRAVLDALVAPAK